MVEDLDLPRVSPEKLLEHEQRFNVALRESNAALRVRVNKSEKRNLIMMFVGAAVALVCYGYGSAMGREAGKATEKQLERYQTISECVGKTK
jgi:hypothetical protein